MTRRWAAACAVFEGRMVACGGGRHGDTSRTVEVYDHVADTWAYMPKMVRERVFHHLVAVKCKLFVIGGRQDSCEVYDSSSKKFSLLKSPAEVLKFDFKNAAGAISMGDRIIVFEDERKLVACYDLNKEQWSAESYGTDELYNFYGCVKLPQF